MRAFACACVFHWSSNIQLAGPKFKSCNRKKAAALRVLQVQTMIPTRLCVTMCPQFEIQGGKSDNLVWWKL